MAQKAGRVRGQMTQAKSSQDMTEVLRETTKLWRKHHLSYDQSRYVVAQVRRALQLSAPRERRRTVARLDKHEVGRLIEAAYRKGSRYGLMVKTLFYTGARVSEFIHIQVVDLRLDLDPPQIYLAVAKGGSDGYVPILPALAQELRTHLRGRKAIYLFESNRHTRYTPRAVQLMVQDAAQRAGLAQQAQSTTSSNGQSQTPARDPAAARHVALPDNDPSWCTRHQVTMTWHNGNERGPGWFSHRLADGSYCKGK